MRSLWGWKVEGSEKLGLGSVCSFWSIILKTEFYVGNVQAPLDGGIVKKPGQVVLRLAKLIPTERSFKLFFDNWFNSPGLQVAQI